jgi:nitrite transporter NirC
MYADALDTLSTQAAGKIAGLRKSLLSHLIRSAFAGMYVGAAIVLIFTVGGTLSAIAPAVTRLLMGVCFGGALTIVVFAGSELFTGSNLVLTVAVLNRRATLDDLAKNWFWTFLGNLMGAVFLAFLVVRSGLFDADPIKSFVLGLVEKKMNIPAEQLIIRAILANWLVCLGVWMAARTKSDTAKIILIWWCMFTFITSGFEHSIANMCGLMLGLLLPHGEAISFGGYAYNLTLATFGNVIGGAVFVGGLYWLASREPSVTTEPVALMPAVKPEA